MTTQERFAMIHDYGVDPESSELWLVGEDHAWDDLGAGDEPGVEYLMANRLIKNLRLLSSIGNEEVLVHMKSCGGDEVEGFAIYDALRLCPMKVSILSYTHARSMTSVILQAAEYRFLMPSSYMLLHWGQFSIEGEYKMVQSNLEFAAKREQRYLDVFADRMVCGERWKNIKKVPRRKAVVKWLKEHMADKIDVILEPEEAIYLGLADEIYNGDF